MHNCNKGTKELLCTDVVKITKTRNQTADDTNRSNYILLFAFLSECVASLSAFYARFEQAYLTSLLSTRDGLYWTDVSDLYNPGRFTYSNGEHDVTFTNWAPNMPGKRFCDVRGTVTSGRYSDVRNEYCVSQLS